MSKYQLIAFDMDGTLLNSEKKISAETQKAIAEAFAAGKEVVLSTGRGIAELEEYLTCIPRLRYLICTSGALVYDVKEKKVIYEKKISRELVEELLLASHAEDIMVHMLSEDTVVQEDKLYQMDKYGMGPYQEAFGRMAHLVPNIDDYYHQAPRPMEKVNLYHTSVESRARSRERLKHLPLEIIDAEETSLECSAEGVDKGEGLKRLCAFLGIPREEAIAVGDADNDVAVLKWAGLSVVMGNGKPCAKELADVIVADCDHDGCAEAIRSYLL